MALQRRQILRAAALLAFNGVADARSGAARRLATGWRAGAGNAVALESEARGADRVGVLELAADGTRLRVTAEVPVPTRAHGLVALPDGGFVGVANRPGRWLLRCDAGGTPMRWWRSTDEDAPTLNGHVESSADGQHLFTTETDPVNGQGLIAVRDANTLEPIARIDSFGLDPHQLLRAGDGTLVVANGGIVRDRGGRKIELERMAPSLVCVDPARNLQRGRWQLADTRLSFRHLAWADDGPRDRLGIALQAEHDPAGERVAAPVLAVWHASSAALMLPELDATSRRLCGGYTGDICAGPLGGFIVSAQRKGRALWWHPAEPTRLQPIAEITEPCALVSSTDGDGTQIAASRGLALWHPTEPPRMLAWPVPLAPDNHAIALHPA